MKIFIFVITLIISFSTGFTQNYSKHRFIYNSDGTDLLANFMFPNNPLTIDNVNSYVDRIANTQVTTFMICSGSDFFNYKSKYGRVLGDNRNGSLGCKDSIPYKPILTIFNNYLNLEREGTDIIESSLKRAKEKGMEAFITYRMNDLHFNDTTLNCSILYPDFWIAHPQYWLNENIGWHSAGALNFSIKEVRNYRLNIIEEQLEKYKIIDGFDLDFMRFIVYFKSNEGKTNAPKMTELIKSIKSKINELSKKRGKKILLSVRVPPDLGFCLKKGLDVKEWTRLGLIDFITMGVHYNGNPEMSVAKFKQELGSSSIPVYTTIDDGGYNPRINYSHGMFRGIASNILAQGGDGIYLFNFFFGDPRIYNRIQTINDSSCVNRIKKPDLLNELGSLETLRKRNKIYCLDDGSSAAYGYKPDTPLPLVVSPDKYSNATIFIGDNIKKDLPEETILFLRSDKNSSFEIFVNNIIVDKQKLEYIKTFERNENLGKGEMEYAYIIPDSLLKQGNNEIRFISITKPFKIKRLEVALKYGDIKTFGFF